MAHIRTCLVGRDRSCDVMLDDPSVSRLHAEVVRLSDGRLYVTDRGTTNGTLVLAGDDWRPIRQAYLELRGRVRFGDVEMSAGRLDAWCARTDPSIQAGTPAPGPTNEVSPDPRKGLVRDPKTGQILERKSSTTAEGQR